MSYLPYPRIDANTPEGRTKQLEEAIRMIIDNINQEKSVIDKRLDLLEGGK